jgi:hypothetical protein
MPIIWFILNGKKTYIIIDLSPWRQLQQPLHFQHPIEKFRVHVPLAFVVVQNGRCQPRWYPVAISHPLCTIIKKLKIPFAQNPANCWTVTRKCPVGNPLAIQGSHCTTTNWHSSRLPLKSDNDDLVQLSICATTWILLDTIKSTYSLKTKFRPGLYYITSHFAGKCDWCSTTWW